MNVILPSFLVLFFLKSVLNLISDFNFDTNIGFGVKLTDFLISASGNPFSKFCRNLAKSVLKGFSVIEKGSCDVEGGSCDVGRGSCDVGRGSCDVEGGSSDNNEDSLNINGGSSDVTGGSGVGEFSHGTS